MKKAIWSLLVIFILSFSCKPSEQQHSGRFVPFAENAIIVIHPYRHAGTWVFDDSRTGVVREPFVSGVPEMIDKLVQDIPDAEKGFRLFFSAQPFPDYTLKLVWRREEFGGNWYYSEKYNSEGWLCPALLKYFKEAPKELYAKAEKK